MTKWLKIYGVPIVMMSAGLYVLYSSIRLLIINHGEFEIIYGWEITGVYWSLAMILGALYQPFKANGKERSINIIIATGSGVMFLSWLAVILVFGNPISSLDTLMILGLSGCISLVSLARLHVR